MCRSHTCSTYGLCPLAAQGAERSLRFYAVRGANYNKLFSTLDRQLPTTRARRSRRGKWLHTSFGTIGGVQLFTYQRFQGGAGAVGVWWVAEKLGFLCFPCLAWLFSPYQSKDKIAEGDVRGRGSAPTQM